MIPTTHRSTTITFLARLLSAELSKALTITPPNLNHATPIIKSFHQSTEGIILRDEPRLYLTDLICIIV